MSGMLPDRTERVHGKPAWHTRCQPGCSHATNLTGTAEVFRRAVLIRSVRAASVLPISAGTSGGLPGPVSAHRRCRQTRPSGRIDGTAGASPRSPSDTAHRGDETTPPALVARYAVAYSRVNWAAIGMLR